MAADPFTRTLVVWWRYGKEHGGDDFRLNPTEVVAGHIETKIERFRRTPPDVWRWWRVSPDLIIERPSPSGQLFGADTRIYYLLEKGVSVIENVYLPRPDDQWKWYVHISDFEYKRERDCWLMKDLFCDILVGQDDRTYHLYDLPDMAQALDVSLISAEESSRILKRIGWVVKSVAAGRFPFEEILRGREAAGKLGW